jgi:hypothetical protein
LQTCLCLIGIFGGFALGGFTLVEDHYVPAERIHYAQFNFFKNKNGNGQK